ISIKLGSPGLTVWQCNAIRYVIALVLLTAQVQFLRNASPQTRPAVGWLPLVPAIVIDAFFGSIFYVYGLSHTDLAVGATLSSLAPLLSFPVAIWLGEERWSAARFSAAGATVAGIVLLVST